MFYNIFIFWDINFYSIVSLSYSFIIIFFELRKLLYWSTSHYFAVCKTVLPKSVMNGGGEGPKWRRPSPVAENKR